MAAPAPSALQKGGELVGRAIAADNAHRYEEALTLYEQAVEFLRQAIAQEQNNATRDSIATKVGEYERRITAIKQALGRAPAANSALPAMPSAPTNAPLTSAAPPPASAPPPSVPKPSAYPPTAAPPSAYPPTAAAPAPTPAAPAPAPAAYPPGYPAPPPMAYAPPMPYAVPGYPPPPPGWPPQYPGYPYPYPYPPPAYPYPYPAPAAPPQPAPPAAGVDTSQVPLGSFIGQPLAPQATTVVSVMPSAAAPAPVYASPLVNTLSAHPQPMADHSTPPPSLPGKPVNAETTHGGWDGAQIRLRAEMPSDLLIPGGTALIRVQIFNSSVTKIDHLRVKLKSLDDSYRPGQRERRVTMAARDFYEGLPIRSGNYDRQFAFPVPPHVAYYQGSRVIYYLSVAAVTGLLVKNLRVRLTVRFR